LKSKCLTLLCLLPFSAALHAACPTDAQVDAYLVDYSKRQLSAGFGNDISAADADCAKHKLAAKLPLYLGDRVGYKAGFTSPASQKNFGMSGPQWAYMFNRNMVDIIAVIPAKFGARPTFEADLLVEVKDPALADATTPLQALACLESVIPFIELPDLMMDGKFSGNALLAANLGFRGGVLGAEVPVQNTQAFVDALGNMTVVMSDRGPQAKEFGRAKGSDLLGHPLNAAMWLAQALKKDGITLKKGDLLSLGGFLPPVPSQSGMHIQLQYLGLPGDPAVSVEFN
jgi:2-oxo-hept-3-ene-1,7-dioate hydratase